MDLIFLEEVDEEFKKLVMKTGRIVYEKNRSVSKYKQTEKAFETLKGGNYPS